jgi:hypothetical protein
LIEAFESKSLRRKFGYDMDGLTTEQIKLHNEKLEEWFVLSTHIVIRFRKLGWSCR